MSKLILIITLSALSAQARIAERPKLKLEDLERRLIYIQSVIERQSAVQQRDRRIMLDVNRCHENCQKTSPWLDSKAEPNYTETERDQINKASRDCHDACPTLPAYLPQSC